MEIKAQTVLAPPKSVRLVAEQHIYIDFEHPYYIIDDIIPFHGSYKIKDSERIFIDAVKPRSFDEYLYGIHSDSMNLSDKQKEFIAYQQYFRKFYAKPPVKFDECVYFNPSENAIDKIINQYFHWGVIPEAFRFYATPLGDSLHYDDYRMKFKLNIPLHEIGTPFYFKKATITNKEYREFVEWVKDSIMHIFLADIKPSMIITKDKNGKKIDPPLVNWNEKIDLNNKDVMEVLETDNLILPENQRFYRRKQFDTRTLNYLYYTPNPTTPADIKKGITRFPIKHILNIYPDTLVWIHDFSWMARLIDTYFWHPAYNDYPVVGITRSQADAYLHWKAAQEQKKLNKEGKGEWIVSYELPTEYEWEMVETADRKDEQPYIYPDHLYSMSDYSYITDLTLKPNAETIPVSFNDNRDSVFKKQEFFAVPPKRELIYPVRNLNTSYFQLFWGEFESVVKSDFVKNDKYIKKNPFFAANYDCNGISFMSGNVSEWLQESYNRNWKNVYNYQHKFLEHLNGKDAKIELNLEDYFNARIDTTLYADDIDSAGPALVRGANWYDRRYGNVAGKNIAGMNAKVFISPDSARSTIGFRYVIKIHRRNEKKIIDSLKATIHSPALHH